MRLDVTKTLNTRSGEPFQRPLPEGKSEPLTIGWACVEALDMPPMQAHAHAPPAPLSRMEKLRRDKLAGRIFDAMTAQATTIDLTAEDQVLLSAVLEPFLPAPRAYAEAIRLIDPAACDKG